MSTLFETRALFFFYEAVNCEENLGYEDSIEYRKKFRKLMGFNISFEEENQSLPKYYKRRGYVLQNYRVMGLEKSDSLVDLTKKAIVDSFENR